MTARRFFAPNLSPEGGLLNLIPSVAAHVEVLRLRVGDQIVLFDGTGREAAASIVDIHNGVTCECQPIITRAYDGPRVVLVQVLPKANKLDAIVRMATELGVAAIHLAHSTHAVSRPDEDRGGAKVERLSRVVIEAARQSGRSLIPELIPPSHLLEVAARAGALDNKVLFWEQSQNPLRVPPANGSTWIVVGAEGGFADSEVQALKKMGYTDAQLAPHILRVETASPVAIALTLHELRRGVPTSAP